MKKTQDDKAFLIRDLIDYCPKSWRINVPTVDYTLRFEDIIPAVSGVIGKTALVAAFAVVWASGLGIVDPEFVTENIRLEIVVGSIFTIVFCALLNPYASPPGTLAPLIPVVPVMAAAGVHPLPLGILIGIMGLIISSFRYFDKIIRINGEGAKGGIILLFGFMGITSSLDSLKNWTYANSTGGLFAVLILSGVLLYLVLYRLKARWLIIPLCAVTALLISALFGVTPEFKTPASLPIINPGAWWNAKWGIGWGMELESFVKALPFALLAVSMWPTDALAIRTLQEANYPKEAKNSILDMNATFIVVSLRNLIGVFFGGSQTSAVWRSFMIPLGTVKRPIGGSAFLLGIMGVMFGILGVPLDVAVFPPLIWLVLIFGIYVPLIEVGLNTLNTFGKIQTGVLCLITGIALNPVLGWIIAILVENFNIIKHKEDDSTVFCEGKIITLIITVITVGSFVLANL